MYKNKSMNVIITNLLMYVYMRVRRLEEECVYTKLGTLLL